MLVEGMQERNELFGGILIDQGRKPVWKGLRTGGIRRRFILPDVRTRKRRDPHEGPFPIDTHILTNAKIIKPY